MFRHSASPSRWLRLALLAAAPLAAHAQTGSVGIGTTTPNASAALDISSTSKGLLLPRLTLAQRDGLTASATAPPVAGLLIYQSDNTPGLYAYDGTAWVRLGADNLGNHTATQALNLQANALTGTGADLGSVVGVGIRADGGLNLGQNTAGLNVFLGYQSGQAATGGGSLFVGYQSGAGNTTGTGNTFAGYRSGLATTTGDFNTFTGANTGVNNGSGSQNTFTGLQAGFNNNTGSGNTFAGVVAGQANTSGSNNTIIGTSADVGSGSLTNATALGANALVSQSNALVLGNNANVGIGTSAPTQKLEVAGQVFSSTGGFRFPDGSVQTSAAAATVGDIKQGLQAADHAGWVKLDGRAISTLTPTQQARARAFGIITALPNATNRVLKQTGGALLGTGGSNTAAVGQNNLPNASLAGTTDRTGGHPHSTEMVTGFAATGPGAFQVYGPVQPGRTSAPVTTTTSGFHEHTVTVALGGSNVPLPVEDAYLNVNQFLYLGL